MASFNEVGNTFEDQEIFFSAFHKFCDENFQPLIIDTNNKKQITLLCRHGKNRPSLSKGQRTKLRYNYLGCTAKITCYKPAKSSVIKITSVNLVHNHEISEAAYDQVQVGEQEKEVIADLYEANCKVSEISRVVKKKFDKNLSSQKIRNLLLKITRSDEDSSMLRDFLEQIEEKKGIVEFKLDTDGEISSLFIASSPMQKAFIDSCCTCVQIDTSFDFDASKYKLCTFCYLNPTTNKGELCALAFISLETAQNFREIFQCFKKNCSQLPSVFILDKDFNEIAVLRAVFSKATILLCNFHVIKYVKNLIATAIVSVEIKNDIMSKFKAVMFARSEADYETKKINFLESSKHVEVRVNKKYVSLKDQFLNNWDNCKEMWVSHYRSSLPTMGDDTNNRIERSFWTLKKSIRDRFPSIPAIEKSIIHLVDFCEQRVTKATTYGSLKSLKIHDSNPQIKNLNEKASLILNDRGCILLHDSLKALENRRENMSVEINGVSEKYEENQEKLYFTSAEACDCTFHCNNQSPCRHIFFKREHDQLPIFELSLFHKRYHKKNISLSEDFNLQEEIVDPEMESLNEEFSVENNDEEKEINRNQRILSIREKYNKVLPFALNIASLISNHGTDQFNAYLNALKLVENLVRDGKMIQCILEPEMSNETETKESCTQTESQENLITDTVSSAAPNHDHNLLNNSSRFQNLQFKSKIKSRGRPKRHDRQTCSFNRSIADNESSINRKKQLKRKKTELSGQNEIPNTRLKKRKIEKH